MPQQDCNKTRFFAKKKSSSVWEASLLKLRFTTENETLGPVCPGCEASSSSVSLSMLKVPSTVVSTTKKISYPPPPRPLPSGGSQAKRNSNFKGVRRSTCGNVIPVMKRESQSGMKI